MQHSPTDATSFLVNSTSQQARAERIDYKIQGVIQQGEYESWVKKIEEIKKATGWILTMH